MRAVQLALLIMCIQFGIGFVVASGVFEGLYYENTLTSIDIPGNTNALDESEQAQTSINIFSAIKDALTWGWIKQFFYPVYNTNAAVKAFVDFIQAGLIALSTVIIGAAAIEFFNKWGSVL